MFAPKSKVARSAMASTIAMAAFAVWSSLAEFAGLAS